MEQRLEMLKKVLADYEAHTNKIRLIELHWTDYRSSGIGNQEICNKVMEFLKDELRKQINEIETNQNTTK